MRKHILCFIIPALLCACESQQQRQSEQSISRAAALLAAAPDSSLHLLARVDTTHLNRQHKARLQVLSVRAKDKLDMDISADTAIFPAKEYLVKIKDEYAATACFAAARVCEVQGGDDEALYHYLLAADRTTDKHLSVLICHNIGRIYYNNRLFRESLAYSKKALAYDEISGATGEDLSYTLELIAIDYIYLSETDSSLIFSNKALELAQQNSTRYRVSFAVATAYHRAGVYTFARSKYRQALAYTENSTGRGKCHLGLAGAYAAMEQYDSAHWYIQKAIPVIEVSNNYADRQEMYRILSIIEAKQPDQSFYRQMYKLFPALEDYFNNEPVMRARERYKNDVIRQREEERDRIATQRKMYFLTILNLVLVLFISAYFFRRYRRRTNREHRSQSLFLQYRLEKEQQAFDRKLDELRRQHEQERQALLDMAENERERYEQKIAEIRREHDREMTAVKRAAKDDNLRMLFRINDMLGPYRAVFDANYDVPVPPAIRRQFEDLLKKYSWDGLYPVINHAMDGLAERIRIDFPTLEEKDYRACCLSYIGFRAQAISLILNDRNGTTRNRLSTVRKTFGLVLRGNIRNYLNEYYGIQDEHEQDEEEDDDTPENRN